MLQLKPIICSIFFCLTGNTNPVEKAASNEHPTAVSVSFSDTLAQRGISDTLLISEEKSAIEKRTQEQFKYSIMFNLPVEMIENLDLFRFIEEWWHTRYLFGGTTKKGIDCSAFTRRLLKDVYCIDAARVVQDQYNQCVPIRKEDLRQGDLVFFETFQPGLSHVGLYLGDNKFVHSANKGVVIEDLNNSYYKKNYRKAGRVLKSNYTAKQ